MSAVPAENMAVVRAMPAAEQAVAITTMLSEARSWLAHAVESTGPETIANFKAQMATVAEATKQLGLSKEIQLDAVEMVRRAERGVGLAVQRGQERGEVLRRGEHDVHRGEDHLTRPTDFGSRSELYGNGTGAGALSLAAMPDADFDAALDAAKAEGNLSRANVARKAREQKEQPADPQTGPPSTPRRRPLPDAFFTAAYDLTKVTERIDRLVEDDRFTPNAEKVAAKHRRDLLRAIELLSKALDRFPN